MAEPKSEVGIQLAFGKTHYAKWGQKPFVLPDTIRQGDQVVVPDIFFHHSSGEEKSLNFKPEVQPDELAAREKETCW